MLTASLQPSHLVGGTLSSLAATVNMTTMATTQQLTRLWYELVLETMKLNPVFATYMMAAMATEATERRVLERRGVGDTRIRHKQLMRDTRKKGLR